VDNFVDIVAPRAAKPLFSRLWLVCPSKKQQSNIYKNQRLAKAIGFVAGWRRIGFSLRGAANIL
jgi:hypothetical protein